MNVNTIFTSTFFEKNFNLVSNGFILRQEELIPTAIETFEGVKVVIDAVLEENKLEMKQGN